MLHETRRIRPALLAALVALAGAAHAGTPPCVTLTALGTPIGENFDTLASTGTSSATPNGWSFAESGTNANSTYTAGTGSATAGDTYSFGSSGSGERAFGGLLSGSLNPTIGACIVNNTGSTVGSLAIAYTGEQWRLGALARTDRLDFQYSTDATGLTDGAWTNVDALDFTAPVQGPTTGALDGNAAANRTAISSSITGLSLANGATLWIRWTDFNATSSDDGLSVDDFSVNPAAPPPVPILSIDNVSLAEGDGGTTNFQFTVSLNIPAGTGGVTFDIATADGTAQDDNPATEDNDYVGQSLTGQTIPASGTSYAFTVVVNGDTAVEPDETFFVNVTNLVGATAGDTQGQGTILNDDLTRIHDVQGSGASSPLVGQTVTVEGVVTGDFQTQGSGELRGFFLQEEDADADADPQTSEGLFVFCSSCPTAVAEGERVRATGAVSEFFGMTQITASSAGSVVVTEAGNHLAEVTPSPIDLPVTTPTIDAFYEPLEGMRVSFVDTLTVSEYFELARYGTVELYEGGRPQQFTQSAAPSAAGYSAHLDALARRAVILEDDDNLQNAPLALPDGSEYVYHPRANGGFSVGTQGPDFFRGGDQVAGLTGVLHWSFAGQSGTDAWRIRPTAANPVVFTPANPRPAGPPAVGGAIRAASVNLLNYFTTIDTTSSNSSGPCGPDGTQDCRGADSVAELNRQRERLSIVLCTLDADVVGLVELENTTPSATITDLLGAVNARCGGADPYAFVNTGGTLGTDAIRVALIYRSATLAPVGAPLVDLDPVHNRPPTAQTFDVVDPANPAFGRRFTAIANHFKSKGCGDATGLDLDQLDGQGCYNATRTAQAARLLAWISATVLPAAGDPDVLLLGDFNSYLQEDPIDTLGAGGYADLVSTFLGASAYSYLFDAQLGRLDYALASASLAADTKGAGIWHISADEVPLFDYNDEVADTGESSFEKKPDGSALAPPRVLFQPASPFRAGDHDPLLVGLFLLADLSIVKSDGADPVQVGTDLAYTITVANAGPDAAANVSWSDPLPAGTTFVSLAAPGGWSCSTPAVGAGGTVSCAIASLPAGSALFTLTVHVGAGFPGGTLLSNGATVASATADPAPANNTESETTTLLSPATVAATKSVSGAFVPGSVVTYTVVLTNSGPATQGDNPGDEFVDVLPAELGLQSASATSGAAFADTGANTVTWNGAIPPGGSVTITIQAILGYGVDDGQVIANQGTAHYDADGNGTNEAAAATDDPATGNPGDATEFFVVSPSIQEIPTLDTVGLALLALALAALAGRRLRRALR